MAEQKQAEAAKEVTRKYNIEFPLKYGCNPHQGPACIYSIDGVKMPFKIINGKPGYINLLDAMNAWQLVKEIRAATNLPAAASFKHVSPAGAAVGLPLDDKLAQAYEVANPKNLTPAALAYLRCRNADPMCSFGDFAALSDVVDEATAMTLKTEVSDGIIAPGYDAKALEILKAKKSGNFVILEVDPNYVAPPVEYREVFGVCFMQPRNHSVLDRKLVSNIVTKNKDLPESAIIDLIIASITMKYTQSNSVGYALNGQMIGVGAGQQSRVDCVKLAGRKVETWYMRQHPKVMSMKFKKGVKKQDRVNARVRYIEGDFTPVEKKEWDQLFDEIPAPLTQQEKDDFMKTLKGVSISSDAFFPFRDSIDQASKRGVSYLVEPGGSVQDEQVIRACDEYGMVMAFSQMRLFHH